MILIVSSAPQERSAIANLCTNRAWPCLECDSLRTLRKNLKSIRPTVVVTRHKLGDGYSDDVLFALTSSALLPTTKVVVLISAGIGATHEARQVALGADCVHRDPVRIDVLMEYLAKYRREAMDSADRPKRSVAREPSAFAGATIDWAERRLLHAGKSAVLTPREIQLVELLIESEGAILTYDTLYLEILGRRFDGDTGNIRVLLTRLAGKAASVGISLREWIEVLLKSGYRYQKIKVARRSPSRRG